MSPTSSPQIVADRHYENCNRGEQQYSWCARATCVVEGSAQMAVYYWKPMAICIHTVVQSKIFTKERTLNNDPASETLVLKVVVAKQRQHPQ